MVVADNEQTLGDEHKVLPSHMGMVEQTPWLQDSWAGLLARRRSGRLAHGLLFHGRLSLGLSELVDTFARLLLCEQADRLDAPCGQCPTCRQCEQGSYPDVHLFRDNPDQSQIGIDAIRDLIARAYFTRHGSMRVVIIERAERLNTSSGNALLKLLEEPPPDMIFLLTSERADQLLATIRSRVQRMPIRWPEHDELITWLQSEQQMPADQAALLAYVDDFSVINEQNHFDPDTITQVWVDLATKRQVVLSALEDWKKIERQLLARWLLRLVCSSMRAQHQLPDDAPQVLQPKIDTLARAYTREELVAILTRLTAFARQAEHALQHELAIEQLAFDLTDISLPGRIDPLDL